VDDLEQEPTKGVLDELFLLARQFKNSTKFNELIKFVGSFKNYSAFNAALVFIQMNGARYVLPAKQWKEKYKRFPISGAQPLVMLKPMGPVMFGFDVSQTEGKPLPDKIENPFEVNGTLEDGAYEKLIMNSNLDGIRIFEKPMGSTLGGYVRDANSPYHIIGAGYFVKKNEQFVVRGEEIPLLSEITLNSNLKDEVNFATLTHELAHIYCGHIGEGDKKLWPLRKNLSRNIEEFEAESVSFMVCKRAGIDTPAAEYLSGYLEKNEEIPEISLDIVFKAVQRIESMTKSRLKSRIKNKVDEAENPNF